MFSVSDFRIYGERIEVTDVLEAVTLTTTGPDVVKGRVVPGDQVQVSFTTQEELSDVAVTLGGEPATAEEGEAGTWSASATVTADVPQGAYYPFAIEYTTARRRAGADSRNDRLVPGVGLHG